MQIAVDCRLPHYRQGGISQYVLQLTKALARIDEENQYFLMQMRQDKVHRLPGKTARFVRRNILTPCHHRWESIALSLELSLDRLDVLHTVDFIPPRWFSGKRVVSMHDLGFLHFPEFMTDSSRRYYNDQIERAVEDADHIITISNYVADEIAERFRVARDRITTTHLAAAEVHHSRIPNDAIDATLARWGLSPGFILSVGTLEPRKNLGTLLKAYAQMRSQPSLDVPLVFVGSRGWLFDETEALIHQLKLVGRVRFIEGCSEAELAHLYRAAAVHVLPSHYEGFGLTALEAMANGCPVVASDSSAIKEVVDEFGILVEPDDIEQWAYRIGQVLTDSELSQTLAGRGIFRAAQFSWQKTARETLEVYEKVVA